MYCKAFDMIVLELSHINSTFLEMTINMPDQLQFADLDLCEVHVVFL